jgi:hypothetical protein
MDCQTTKQLGNPSNFYMKWLAMATSNSVQMTGVECAHQEDTENAHAKKSGKEASTFLPRLL